MDDEVSFELGYLEPIRDDDEYGGYRVAIVARYEGINTPLKIDITTGDMITPGAIRYTFHSNFENKAIEVWAYTIETILAEKVETILRRSVLNTRPRDFYDVYIIMKTQRQAVSQETYLTALHATCEKRNSQKALQSKDEILRNIQSDPAMQQRWDRYCIENYYANGIKFDDVMGVVFEIMR